MATDFENAIELSKQHFQQVQKENKELEQAKNLSELFHAQREYMKRLNNEKVWRDLSINKLKKLVESQSMSDLRTRVLELEKVITSIYKCNCDSNDVPIPRLNFDTSIRFSSERTYMEFKFQFLFAELEVLLDHI